MWRLRCCGLSPQTQSKHRQLQCKKCLEAGQIAADCHDRILIHVRMTGGVTEAPGTPMLFNDRLLGAKSAAT